MRISGTDASQNTLRISSEPVKVSPGSQKIKVQEKPQKKTQGGKVPQNTDDNNKAKVSEKAVSDAVEKVNKALEGTNRRMEYSVHKRTNEIIVKVIDETTGEIIREVPPEKILDMVANMLEMAGLIVDERR